MKAEVKFIHDLLPGIGEMMSADLEKRVASHYENPSLLDAIDHGLHLLGKNPAAPSTEDLAPVDEFHTAGRISTLKALDMTPLRAGMHVLDAGCGIGGTARCLARERKCTVAGIDLTASYITAARELTKRTGLGDKCTFQIGSVLDMPFGDAAFDAAVSFHVAMNIEDRARFYGELARVTRKNAPLCIFDVMKGPTAGMHYPVPWAETGANSYLKTPAETRTLLNEAGFSVTRQESLQSFAKDFFQKMLAAVAEEPEPPAIGLHLLTGANTLEKFQNYMRALTENQIDPVIMVARRH